MCGPSEAIAVGSTALAYKQGRDQIKFQERQARQSYLYQQQQLAYQRELDIAVAGATYGATTEWADQVMDLANLRHNYAMQEADLMEEQGELQQTLLYAEADTTEALAHRAAHAERVATEQLVSKGKAAAAMGGMLQEDVQPILGEIAADGQYNELFHLYEGAQARADTEFQGDLAKWQQDYNAWAKRTEADFQYEDTRIYVDREVEGAKIALDIAMRPPFQPTGEAVPPGV